SAAGPARSAAGPACSATDPAYWAAGPACSRSRPRVLGDGRAWSEESAGMGSAMERAEAGVAARAFRGRVVTQTEVLPDGFVVVDGDAIVWVGASSEVPEAYVDAARGVRHDGLTLLPGLIDLHNHGGGGVGFSEAADADDARRAVAEHRAHGTTTLVASLVTAPPDAMLRQVA